MHGSDPSPDHLSIYQTCHVPRFRANVPDIHRSGRGIDITIYISILSFSQMMVEIAVLMRRTSFGNIYICISASVLVVVLQYHLFSPD